MFQKWLHVFSISRNAAQVSVMQNRPLVYERVCACVCLPTFFKMQIRWMWGLKLCFTLPSCDLWSVWPSFTSCQVKLPMTLNDNMQIKVMKRARVCEYVVQKGNSKLYEQYPRCRKKRTHSVFRGVSEPLFCWIFCTVCSFKSHFPPNQKRAGGAVIMLHLQYISK